ncbi:MAG: hypothetical protein IJW64_03405 [Clostridia bacterium]|nr:hypothetical protein [Clostridia bacterium]
MKREYNENGIAEITTFKENSQVKESNFTAQENFSSKPNVSQKETNTAIEKPKNKAKNKKRKGIALANMLVATVVVATTTVGSGIINPRKAEVDLNEIWAGLNEISYQIEVQETEADLVITLENDFTEREEKLSVGENEGTFTDLAPNMEYVLSVKFADGLKETVEKRQVKTNGENPKPEPEPESSQKPNVEFYYIPAKSADGQFVFTATVNSGLLVSYSQIYVKIYENYFASGAPIVEERIYYKDEDSKDVVENRIGEQVEINVKDMFYISNGYVEVVAMKKKQGAVASTDTSDTHESVIIYQSEIEIYEKRTAIENVTVTPSQDGSTLKVSVSFIDENGIWNTSVNDEGETYLLAVWVYDEDYVDDTLTGYVQTSGQTVEMVIPADQYLDGLAVIDISYYDENGQEIILYSRQDVEIKV